MTETKIKRKKKLNIRFFFFVCFLFFNFAEKFYHMSYVVYPIANGCAMDYVFESVFKCDCDLYIKNHPGDYIIIECNG